MDGYPMPVADMLVDAAVGYKVISFMDGNAGYNKIFISEEDIQKTTFRCPGHVGLFEWIVMTFGLKNTGATYQRAMNYIFHEIIGKIVEIYIERRGEVKRAPRASSRFAQNPRMHKEAWFKDESKQVRFWCISWPIFEFYGT